MCFEQNVRMQRPLLLKGHERPITMVKYNRQGDILFSTGKVKSPRCFYAPRVPVCRPYGAETTGWHSHGLVEPQRRTDWDVHWT
jgi:hypothetical protein